jgi:hypothetical protein
MAGVHESVKEVVSMLLQDVRATLGPGYEKRVKVFSADAARRWRLALKNFAPRPLPDEFFKDLLASEFQQYVHDERISTVWPPCPRHERHPMFLVDGMWCADGVAYAKLGELTTCYQTPSDEAS